MSSKLQMAEAALKAALARRSNLRDDMEVELDKPYRECRCCRTPVPYGQLACRPHWKMLPEPLRMAIVSEYGKRHWKAYAVKVMEADKIWQASGIWKAGKASADQN